MPENSDELWANSRRIGPNTSESVAESLEFAIASAPLTPRDIATVALARRYAIDIDQADVLSVQGAKLLRAVGSLAILDPALYGALEAYFGRVERVSVLERLGPKLLAAMTDLGMSPRARNDVGRGVKKDDDGGNVGRIAPEPGDSAPVAGDDLARLRAERKAARFHNS